MTRRWQAGWTYVVAGLPLRVVPGRKSSDDLVMQWRVNGEWWSIPMAATAIIADFWYENEDVLYPPTRGFLGGRKYTRYLRKAIEEGWESAEAELQSEKAAKRDRDAA